MMAGGGQPPADHRFRKGQSGHPKGRPRKEPPPPPSAFDIVIDRTLDITLDGQSRAVPIEAALQHKTYADAVAGSHGARRAVLKMIVKREQAITREIERTRRHRPVEQLIEAIDPANANRALLILGIVNRDPAWDDRLHDGDRLLLEPWAVAAALARRNAPRLTRRHIESMRCRVRDPDSIDWPEPVERQPGDPREMGG